MESSIVPNSPQCRICLKTGSLKLLNLYQSLDEDDEESPRHMLSKLGVEVEEEHCLTDLPKQICKSCNCELNLAYQFFEKAMQSQSLVKEYLTKNQIKSDVITETKIIENVEQNVSCNGTTEQDPENYTAIEEVVEFLDEDCKEFVEIDKIPNNADETKSSMQTENVILNSNIKVNSKPSVAKKTKRCTAVKRQCTKESFLSSEPSKRGKKPKNSEDTKCHVCEICGNVFTKRGRLTEHLRRHETEAKYVCELCDERFILREALRRHMFQHLGGKPFKCDFCSRTFFYESVKKAHEAIHSGHKRYVCDKCHKAFAYPHTLKKHQLIHDDIKLFSCKYCKKDFRLQHHMKQHEETKAHMNAVQTEKLAKQLHKN